MAKPIRDEYRFANVLDSLIASHVLPPINVVFIDSLDPRAGRKSCRPTFFYIRFMAMSCCPGCDNRGWMPFAKTVVASSSYGSLAASWVALRYPRLFANVLSPGRLWVGAKGGKPAG